MKINYDLLMKKEIEKISTLSKKPRLLIHSCCAPCSSAVIECLLNYFEITIFFYNPNITFEMEYIKRLEELKEYIKMREYNITIIEGEYLPKTDFFEKIKGLEKEKEGGKRCFECYKLRMEKTAKRGVKDKFDYFTTALSISPHKNAHKINQIGENLEKEFGIKFLFADFKKGNRYLYSIEISKEYELYRQDYCGCIYSKQNKKLWEVYNFL